MKATVSVWLLPAAGVVMLTLGAAVSRFRFTLVTCVVSAAQLGVTVTVLLPSPAGSVMAADQALKAAPGSSSVAAHRGAAADGDRHLPRASGVKRT